MRWLVAWLGMNYVTCVSFVSHIKILAASLLMTCVSTSAIQAANLSSLEQNVCPSLQVCIDIIRRHDASEFDYDVLESQFRNFGPKGRAALFNIVESDAGNPDIARMISSMEPLSLNERSRIKTGWSKERAASYLPLLIDGHPLSRDLLLLSLGSDEPGVREAARRALGRIPKIAQSQPLPENLTVPLLAALARDPLPEAAPYLARLNAAGHQDKFGALLRSGDADIVSAAYSALYRNSPPQAFELLLAEMGRVTTAVQSQAIGEMLVRRHANREDGFYLKFARDISSDKTRPFQARASGLHAVLISEESEFPPFTPELAEAFVFLVKSKPFISQKNYLPTLKRVKAVREMRMIWDIAQQEKWVNRDRISEYFLGEETENEIISDLIRSNDLRSFAAGIKKAKPIHSNLIRAKAGHPIHAIGDLARKGLKLPDKQISNSACRISEFDSDDLLNQMPFFAPAWTSTQNGAKVSLDRKYLTAAHPSKMGWLAGYNFVDEKSRSAQAGGALVYYKFKGDNFERIEKFSNPIAILPERVLKLGQTTERFWVIDNWNNEASNISAYVLDLSTPAPLIKHLGALPNTAHGFSVAPSGDLLVSFKDQKQAPIRLTQRGDISLACSALRGAPKSTAPN